MIIHSFFNKDIDAIDGFQLQNFSLIINLLYNLVSPFRSFNFDAKTIV